MQNYNKALFEHIYNETEKHGFAVINSSFKDDCDRLIELGYCDIDPAPQLNDSIRIAVSDEGEQFYKNSMNIVDQVNNIYDNVSTPTGTSAPTSGFKLPENNLQEIQRQTIERLQEVSGDDSLSQRIYKENPEFTTKEFDKAVGIQANESPFPPDDVINKAAAATLKTIKPRKPFVEPPVGTLGQGLAPPVKRAPRTAKHNIPFETMGVLHHYYIPATEDKPEPVKDYYHVIRQANLRYAVEEKDEYGNVILEKVEKFRMKKSPNGEEMGKEAYIKEVPKLTFTRRYEIFHAKDIANQPHQTGAYVFRME